MRATTLLLSAALTLCSTATFAQSSYNIVVEPVGQSIDTIIHAPIEYDENGVVKAQHFNADDLTDEEYQAILDEAARIRSYRDANGLNFESEYVASEYIDSNSAPNNTTTYSSAPAPVVTSGSNYQIELFAPETPTYSAETVVAPLYSTPTVAAPTYSTSSSAATTHTVSKGETLYRISKQYGVTVPDLKAENAISGTTLSVGQQLRIPGVIVQSANTVAQPIYANTTSSSSYISNHVVEPVPVWNSSGVATSVASEAVYAVLAKDTLYKISRFTCVDVKDIISRNDIRNPNALTPGQRLTLPAGHCLNR